MNQRDFATWLQELNSSQNWGELKKRADDFKSTAEKEIDKFSHDNLLTYHGRYKNHHFNMDRKIHEGIFYLCKNKKTGLLNMT